MKINQLLKEKISKKAAIIIIVIASILVVTSVGGFIYYQTRNNLNNPNPSDENKEEDNTNDSDEIEEENNESEEENNENVVEGTIYKVAKWNNSVVYNHDKSFFKDGDGFNSDPDDNATYIPYKYFNVATLTTGETVVRVTCEWEMDEIFIVDNNNNIKLLAKYSSSDKEELISGIIIDKGSTIPEIYPEGDITYKGQTLEFQYHGLVNDEYAIDETKATKVDTTEFGDLYEYKYFVSEDLYVRRFYLKTPDKTAIHYYELKNVDIDNDDGTLKVNWLDSSNKTLSFEMPISNCGSGGPRLHIKGFDPSDGIKIGTITINGRPLYKLNDDVILKLLYDEYYQEGWEGHDYSFEKYKTLLTSVVYQDDLGEWIVLANDKYSHSAECGKPVIYLYPEKNTYVNVSVGANVTVSDPTYVFGGWKNVLARPNGNLTYQGKEYESLFWEGRGNGLYPNVSGIGKVVTQDKLISTVKEDLKSQGLNDKEIADFIEFWKDHLPTTPYVKLTWLTTEEMNTLAPLRVSPKPDTVIRVFLDAKGLNSPIKLTPQQFTKKERNGFTLVEWGGLLKK
jgi:hypothetical protein